MTDLTFPLDRETVMKYIPHRDPLLFIDQVIAADLTHCHARTYTKPTWPGFLGHFPGKPVVPGVLLIEAIAQAGALIVFLRGGHAEDEIIAFSSVEQARFRKPVLPDQHMDIHAEIMRERSGLYKFEGHIDVDGQRVIDVRFSAMKARL